MRLKKKLNKLINNPKGFIKDAIVNLTYKSRVHKKLKLISDKDIIPTFTFGIHVWKRSFFEEILPNNELFHLPFNLNERIFLKKWSKIISSNKKIEFLIWGLSCPDFLLNFLEENNIKITYVEDGFIRSVDLGANQTLPLSLNFDKKTPYFNSAKESDLEYILKNFTFTNGIIKESKKIQEKLQKFNLSKYNHVKDVNISEIYGKKINKRVLVIGQVEDDASIKFGCIKKFTNNDLVKLAYNENPNAEIIYKPHPDILNNKRKLISNPKEIESIARIVYTPIPMLQAFETIDHVYTITSLAGFEALLYGIKKVTTIGSPFYAGWGLTDDRQKNIRRNRELSLNKVFAAAYILYPKYYSPYTKKTITLDEALEILIKMKNEN